MFKLIIEKTDKTTFFENKSKQPFPRFIIYIRAILVYIYKNYSFRDIRFCVDDLDSLDRL